MTRFMSPWKLGAAAALLALGACGGGGDATPAPSPPPPPATYTISGTVFSSGGTIVLQNNGGDDLTLGNVGTFSFATQLASGAAYAVTVKSSPSMPLQTCVTGSNAGGLGDGNGGRRRRDEPLRFLLPGRADARRHRHELGRLGPGAEFRLAGPARRGQWQLPVHRADTQHGQLCRHGRDAAVVTGTDLRRHEWHRQFSDGRRDERAGHLLRTRLRLRHRERHRRHALERHRRQRDLGRRRHGAPHPEHDRDQRSGDRDDPEVRHRQARRQRADQRARRLDRHVDGNPGRRRQRRRRRRGVLSFDHRAVLRGASVGRPARPERELAHRPRVRGLSDVGAGKPRRPRS